MFFKKKIKETENTPEPIIDKTENDLEQEDNKLKSIKKIIDGKLYDTGKAKFICKLYIWHEKIPNYTEHFCFYSMFGENIAIYEGNNEWFTTVHGSIIHVSEEWVKSILGEYDVEKYIELFGEPELA